MDVADFVLRLKQELTSPGKWIDVAAVATQEQQADLRPNELLIFVRPEHPERDAIAAFHVTVLVIRFPPDDDRRNGRIGSL